MSLEKHVEPFTELAKTFPKYNENVVNSLYSFLIDNSVPDNSIASILFDKVWNERKKCVDTEIKTDISPGEKQVIYYISGDVVYSLRKKYTRLIKLISNSI